MHLRLRGITRALPHEGNESSSGFLRYSFKVNA
jgi:hypothetical protein